MPRTAGTGTPERWDYRRVLRLLGALPGLLAFAASILFQIGPALDVAGRRLCDAIRNARETEEAALSRFRGPEYFAALSKILETIPRDAAYYLPQVPFGHSEYFVRFDLAPRRPVLLERFPKGTPPAGAPRWVVLPRMGPPGPEVIETAAYFRREARP
ncbi:MAG TPA: hypothetical protein VL084_08480 [Thermoanaerobaculia bacterium]|nr:hypothetical protein [Thermoanaerobaculia bacterium]